MTLVLKYKYSDYSIWFTAIAACIICYAYTWHNHLPVNFLGGDARYYYIYLQSTFIRHDLIDFSLLDPANGVVLTHHPVGLSILLLPFFLAALFFANILNYPADGVSAPFQAAISIAAIFYCVLGLIYMGKLLKLNSISDKVTAMIVVLIFFGTTLFHYTINESGMSHVYSFCLLSVFLYHGFQLVSTTKKKYLYYLAIVFGLIILLRPNNGLIILSLFFWFKTKTQFLAFFKNIFRLKSFYLSTLLCIFIIAVQPLTWLWKENSLFVNRYATYGFYWLHPHLKEMLFGFDAGFFIYTPLCFLFLFGLFAVNRENKFMFYSITVFILLLFYVFSAYSAYTYFDGLGIRVLVDYYSLFALLGGKLFMHLLLQKSIFYSIGTLALFLVTLNLICCYQAENNILARSGMNLQKWKYIFLRTGKSYENCLGGSNDLPPYSKVKPVISLQGEIKFDAPFQFDHNDYGAAVSFDSIGFSSKRVQLKIKINRREAYTNSSQDVLVCAILENKDKSEKKGYLQFKLNETPASDCCDDIEYDYNANMEANFKPSDRLSVYLWNIQQKPFSIDKFSVQLYNFNY